MRTAPRLPCSCTALPSAGSMPPASHASSSQTRLALNLLKAPCVIPFCGLLCSGTMMLVLPASWPLFPCMYEGNATSCCLSATSVEMVLRTHRRVLVLRQIHSLCTRSAAPAHHSPAL